MLHVDRAGQAENDPLRVFPEGVQGGVISGHIGSRDVVRNACLFQFRDEGAEKPLSIGDHLIFFLEP